MKISSKYKPLFKLLGDYYPEVDTVIMTGGRYSGKSFAVSVFANEGAVQYGWDIMYTRFTNESIEDSIKKEFLEKLDILGTSQLYNIKNDRARLRDDNGGVVFKGMKTGAKNQKANLKSLKGFNCLIVDEAEEIPDESTFEKVYLSIRSPEKRNVSILLLNPDVKTHWIYQTMFESKGVLDGFNGVKDNVMYIHTSYLDLAAESIPENILKYYERMKGTDPDKYENIIMGGWIDSLQGSVFPKESLNRFALADIDRSLKRAAVAYTDVATGGGDYYCTAYAELIGDKFYVTDVIMNKAGSNETIPQTIAMLTTLKPDFYQIETNAAGQVFYDQIHPKLTTTATIPLHNSTGKETRIINQAYFIKRHFVFRNDYAAGSEYDIFMKQICSFNLDKKMNVNDDAPDVASGLCAFALTYYERFLES